MNRAAQTPFAEAIESFLRDTKKCEDTKSNFYKETLAEVGDGKNGDLSSQSPEASSKCADHLAGYIEDLARTRKRDSKTLYVAERLRPFVNGLSQFTTACDVMIQAAPSAAIVLYGGARLVLQLAQKSYECYDTIVDMLAEIGHLLSCYHLFSSAHADVAEMRTALVSSYKTIIKFWQKASELLSRKTYKLLLLSAVKPLDKEWQRCHDGLEKDRKRVEFYAVAVNANMLKQKDLATKSEKSNEVRKQVVAWIKGGEDDESLDCRGTIRMHVEKRHPGTCDWLFDNGEYRSWLETNTSASLFLTAAPGAGKTIIASSVVQHLQDNGRRAVAFFYSFNDPVKRKAITAIRALALQLLALNDSVPESVLQLYRDDAALHCYQLNDTRTAIGVLVGLLKQLPRIHLVVDGLDECRNTTEMLLILRLLLEAKSYGIVKWLFTGRPERQIRTELLPLGVVEVDAPMQNLTNDIRTFMEDRLQNDKCLGCIDDWIDQSEGNFLWASLMLQIMDGEGLTCEEDVEEELTKFPQGLTGCYLRTLHRLTTRSERQQELAGKIFAFLVASFQPLRLSELSHALAAKTSAADFSPKRVPTLSLIEELCSQLVTFDRSVKGSAEDPVLKFAHKSIQDFFMLDPETIGASCDVRRFFTTPESSDSQLGQACLQYLSYERYGSPRESPALVEDKAHAFLRYAATYWFRHLGNVPPTADLQTDVQRFLDSSSFWNCVFVQCRIAPHLYGRFRKMNRHVYSINTSGLKETGQSVSVRYGSPVPIWMDTSSVGDLLAFTTQWHRILNSRPDQVRHCVMDREWISRWPRKRGWQLQNPVCWAVGPDPPAVKHLLQQLSLSDARLTQRCETIQEGSVTILDDLDFAVPQLASVRDSDHVMASIVPPSLKFFAANPHILRQDHDATTFNTNSTSGPRHSLPRRVVSISHNISVDGRAGAPLAIAVQWVYNVSRPSNEHCNHSPHDSGFESADSEDGSEAETSSDYEDDDSSIHNPSAREHFLTIWQAHQQPISYSWSLQRSDAYIKCAFHPTKPWVLWTPAAHECCIADTESGNIGKIVLPEPADVDLTAAAFVHKELHFSDTGDQLYYLVFAADSTECGFHGTLSISSLELEQLDDDQILIHRTTPAITLRYSWAGDIQAPYIVTTWSADAAHVALPQLACDPKIVRLSLKKLPSSDTPCLQFFETLTMPVFFPASAPDRDPSLQYLGEPTSDKATLVLTLAGEKMPARSGVDEGDDDDTQQGPVLMAWKLNNKADWRMWDAATDAQSDAYKSAESTFDHLRGTYVDADQAFSIPIRSGLDWRKQAFVVSCG